MVSQFERWVAHPGHSHLVCVLLAGAEVLPGHVRHVAVHQTVRAKGLIVVMRESNSLSLKVLIRFRMERRYLNQSSILIIY